MDLALPPEPKIVSLDEFVEETKAYMEKPRETRFGRTSLTDVATRKIKGLDYVVDGWMVAREQSFLAGESQSGKSFAALHLGMCVASGQEFLGRKTKKGLVIYQAGESGTGVTDLRIPAWLKHYGEGLDLAQIPFEILTARVNLFQAEGNGDQFLEAVKNIAEEWKAYFQLQLVVIDTFAKALSGGNENDARDIGRILERGDQISRETGAHVCFVHHVPKNGSTLRGHGSLKGDTDSVAMVTCDENKVRTMTFDKVKDGPNGGKLQFELMAVEIGRTEEEDKPITSCVVMPVGEKAAAKAAGEKAGYRLNDGEAVFFRSLLTALDRYGAAPPSHVKLTGRASKWVEYDEVKRIYVAMCPYEGVHDEGDEAGRLKGEEAHRNKLKARLRRTREYLMQPAVNVIGVEGKHIWWTGRPIRDFKETQAEKPKPETNQAIEEAREHGLDGLL